MTSEPSHFPVGTSERTFFLYDASGEIVHAHTEVTLPGADLPSTVELERRAIAAAQAFVGDKVKKLRVLTVGRDELKLGLRYRVDVKRGVLRTIDNPGGAAAAR